MGEGQFYHDNYFLFPFVNNRTRCLVIKGVDRTKPISDLALSIDRPLFQALSSLSLGLKRDVCGFSSRLRYLSSCCEVSCLFQALEMYSY